MDGYTMDLEARQKLESWKRLSGLQLKIEASIEGFQPESQEPERVGLEALSDEFSPEELIRMTVPRQPLIMDWDAVA